ncbi:MAG: FecR family protein [Candidatus Binatia bacterium]
MLRFRTLITVWWLAAAGLATAADPAVIGRVKNSDGEVTLTRAAATIPVTAGTPVHQNDSIQTGGNGSLGLTFKDGSRISIGPSTRIVIDEFVFAPREEKLSFVTRITQGTLYYVSGAIAKIAPEKAAFVTPDGTIGVRGTKFVVKVGR